MAQAFYLRDGSLTRYALGCGYVQKHGTEEKYVTLTNVGYGGGYVVRIEGRDRRREQIYLGPSITAARRSFNAAKKSIPE